MKKTIIICLFLLSVLGISSNMVLFHGMGGTGSSMLWYKDMLGINNYTYITPTYNCKNSIEQEAINMDKTDFFNQSIFIGYSQGGLIARSIMNQTTTPSVKTFITIGIEITANVAALYDTLLIGSSESDGVVSSHSAELKSTYVQSEGFVLPKKLVDGADHIDLNSEKIKTAVKYILNAN